MFQRTIHTYLNPGAVTTCPSERRGFGFNGGMSIILYNVFLLSHFRKLCSPAHTVSKMRRK